MKPLLFALLAPAAALGCGSGAVYGFEPTTVRQPAKPPSCEFQVAAAVPHDGAFEEIGVLDARRIPSRSLTTFKLHVRPTVCEAGGDLVVGEVNGSGYYVRAVVFRRVPGAPSAPASPLPATTKL